MAIRKSLIMASSVFILALAVLVLGWGIIRKTQLDASSSAIAINTIELLFSAANSEAVTEVIRSGRFPEGQREILQRNVTAIKRTTGTLESIDAVFGSADVPLLPFLRAATANYTVALTTRGGAIEASLDLTWVDDGWQISPITFTGAILQN